MSLEKPSLSQETGGLPPKHTTLSPEEQHKLDELYAVNGESGSGNNPENILKINDLLEAIASRKVGGSAQQPLENTQKPTTLPQPSTKDTVVTNTIDFIPVIGSAKMILESLRGKQYGTDKELSGKLRFIHGLSGALFLAADLTGIGAIASELGKAGIKLSLRSLEKKALQNVVVNKTIKQEAGQLAVEGEKRRNLQEGIANQ